MSDQSVYPGPTEAGRGGPRSPMAPSYYGEPGDGPAVLARVPDLQAESPRVAEPPRGVSRPSPAHSPYSTRMMAVVGAMVLVAGVIGYLLGRVGGSDSSSSSPPEAWYPTPPAKDAPEAPVWPGAGIPAAKAPAASPDPQVFGVEQPPLAGPTGSTGTGHQGGLVPLDPPPTAVGPYGPSANQEAAPRTWSSPGRGTTARTGGADQDRFNNDYARAVAEGRVGRPAAADYSEAPYAGSSYPDTTRPPQAGANQSMRLESAVPSGQGYAARQPAVESYSPPSDPRLAYRPTTGSPALPAAPSARVYPQADAYRSQAYPQGEAGTYPPAGSSTYPPAGTPAYPQGGTSTYPPAGVNAYPQGGAATYPPAGVGTYASPAQSSTAAPSYETRYYAPAGSSYDATPASGYPSQYGAQGGTARFEGTIEPSGVRTTTP